MRRESANRAVSDTIGFVLVFALITATIAVVFTVGISGVESAQEAERDTNVERAFDVFHDNMKDLHRDGVPSRATEIQLAGGSLHHGDHTRIEVNATGWNTSSVVFTRPIVYTNGDTEITYEAGAVTRSDGDAHTMLVEPDLISEETMMLSLVDLGARGSSVGGDTTVLVISNLQSRGTVDRPRTVEGGDVITITIESPRAEAWERYYEDVEQENADTDVTLDADEETVTVEFTVDTAEEIRLYVSVSEIDVRFS